MNTQTESKQLINTEVLTKALKSMQSLGLVIISMEYGVISDDCGDSYGFEESNLPWEDAEFFRWRGDELIAVHI